MPKQPKNSTAKQILEIVTNEEVKQNKKEPQNYTKKMPSCQRMEFNETSE